MKIYVSHPIRGAVKREDVTTDEEWSKIMTHNSGIARSFGNELRMRFPQHEFYVPADHEEFVQRAFEAGVLDEETILKIDCEILHTCDSLILFDWQHDPSSGMLVELEYAEANKIPAQLVPGSTEDDFEIVDRFLVKLFKEGIK